MENNRKEETLSSLELISADIDNAVVDMFTTLQQLFAARNLLESNMKSGFLNMAKARYEMGSSTAVSKLQYCEQDLDLALYHVAVNDSTTSKLSGVTRSSIPQSSGLKFQVLCNNTPDTHKYSPDVCSSKHADTDTQKMSPDVQELQNLISKTSIEEKQNEDEGVKKSVDISELGVGVRRRNVKGEEGVKTDEEQGGENLGKHSNNSDDDDDDDDDVKKSNVKNDAGNISTDSTEKSSDKNTACDTIVRKDPLRWFGVLVPRSLRASQSSFHEAVKISCDIASLQSSLLIKRARVVELRKKKAVLTDLIDKETGKGDKQKQPELITGSA